MKNEENSLTFGQRIMNMIVMGTAFLIIGQLLPKFFYEYIDTTTYYEIKNPSLTNKTTYKRGESVHIYLNRLSKVNVDATAYLELVMIAEDSNAEVLNIKRDIVLSNNPEKEIIKISLPIPQSDEEVPCGKYFVRGTVKYRINNVLKFTNFYTTEFNIE